MATPLFAKSNGFAEDESDEIVESSVLDDGIDRGWLRCFSFYLDRALTVCYQLERTDDNRLLGW